MDTTVCSIFLTCAFLCAAAAAAPQVCSSKDNFSCRYNNPCSPTLCTDGTLLYKGTDDRRYVECVGEYGAYKCKGRICPRYSHWNDTAERCEVEGGAAARCALKTYSCDRFERNPCHPHKCYKYNDYYLATARDRYITCGEGEQGESRACITHRCPQGLWWDTIRSECRPRHLMKGCTSSFTVYNATLVGNNGVGASLNLTQPQCLQHCLSRPDCVAFTYFYVDGVPEFESLPPCNLALGYGWNMIHNQHAVSYVRDGCAPSMRPWY